MGFVEAKGAASLRRLSHSEMNSSEAAPQGRDVLYGLLEKHKARPSLPGIEWAKKNWHNLQSVIDRISALQKDAKLRPRKGKSIVWAVLGASLAAAVEAREQQQTADSQFIQTLQDLVRALQDHVVNLKEQLDKEKNQANYLQLVLKKKLLAEKNTSPRSEKTIEYPHIDLEEGRLRLEKLNVPAASLHPLRKTQYTYKGGEDKFPQIPTKEVPLLLQN